jgi:hypothetical protein
MILLLAAAVLCVLVLLLCPCNFGASVQNWYESADGLCAENNGVKLVWLRGEAEPVITRKPGAKGTVTVHTRPNSTVASIHLANGNQTMDGEFDWGPRKRRGRSPRRIDL